MFDLEQEIRRWRRTMAFRMPLRREAIGELESHLRDAVQSLMQDGLSPREAWLAAQARLGAPEAIAAEYGKLPGCTPWRWMPAKVVMIAFATFVALMGWLVGAAMLQGQGNALLACHVFCVTIGYMTVFAVGVVATWSVLSRAVGGWSPAETEALRATMRMATITGLALTFVGTALGSVWAREHLGRFWGWDIKEIAAAVVLAWNAAVLLLLLVRRGDERLGLLLGLAGSVVVAVCWFGPALLPNHGSLHDYTGNRGAIAVFLLGMVLLELTLATLALLPAGRLRLSRAK